ncbi:MAG: ATP-binding protein [Myxococcota bacterium]|nr:ATP-binding protein [Myxococcota bacterium]
MATPAPSPGPLTNERFRAYLIGRTGLILIMAGALRAGLSFEITGYYQTVALDIAALLVLAASAFGIFMMSRGGDLSRLAFAQVLLDPVLAGLIVFATGSEESPISFFFVLVVMNGTSVMGRRAAYGAAIFSMLVLTVITLALGPAGSIAWHLPTAPEARSVGTHVLAFLAAAWLSSTLDMQARAVKIELLQLRDLHERMIEHLPHGLLLVDTTGYIVVANPTARVMIGSGTLVGKRVGKALPTLGRVPTSGYREVVHRVGEQERVFRSAFTPFSGGTLVTLENITELHGMQQQVMFGARMASIGRMAAGLAHELRNPLANMTGASQELENCSSQDFAEERVQLISIIRQEGDRLNKLVEEFLIVAQPRRPLLAPRLLEEVTAEVVDAYDQGPFGKINPVTFDPGGVHLIDMEAQQLHQLLHNVLSNAAQSSEEGKPVLVSTARMAGEAGALDQVVLSVQDQGCGIPKGDLQRIFDPFYSRRQGGGGSGLGLAIVMRIVVDHGAHIEVDSEPGRGTTVHLFFSISRGTTDA